MISVTISAAFISQIILIKWLPQNLLYFSEGQQLENHTTKFSIKKIYLSYFQICIQNFIKISNSAFFYYHWTDMELSISQANHNGYAQSHSWVNVSECLQHFTPSCVSTHLTGPYLPWHICHNLCIAPPRWMLSCPLALPLCTTCLNKINISCLITFMLRILLFLLPYILPIYLCHKRGLITKHCNFSFNLNLWNSYFNFVYYTGLVLFLFSLSYVHFHNSSFILKMPDKQVHTRRKWLLLKQLSSLCCPVLSKHTIISLILLPILTTGQDFRHSCLHRFGLHLSALTIAIRVSLSCDILALLKNEQDWAALIYWQTM